MKGKSLEKLLFRNKLYSLLIADNCFIACLSVFKKSAGVVFLCLLGTAMFSQKNKTISLDINSVFCSQILVLDSTYNLQMNHTIRFEALKFYLTNITLYKNNKLVWKEKQSYHLYDQAEIKTHSISILIPSNIIYDKVNFDVGIDSITNVSGALGGDLDPTKGMYWTWQSGYINFKLEGTTSLSTNQKKEFQLHLGGYQKPFCALQRISLNSKNQENISIEFDVKSFIEGINWQTHHHIMSPSNEAVKLSNSMTECFKLK